MKKRILFLSAIDFKEKSIRVIKETPEAYARAGWEVDYIVARDNFPFGNYFYESEIFPEGVNIHRLYWPLVKLRSSRFDLWNVFLSKVASWVVILKLLLKGLKLIKGKRYDVIYGYEAQGVLAMNVLRLFSLSSFRVARFQGVFYIKDYLLRKRYVKCLLNFDVFLALWLPSDILIMTDDGTQGNKVLKKIRSRSDKVLFLQNGVDNMPLSPRSYDRSKLTLKLGVDGTQPIFLMVSRLVAIKRVHLAVEAIYEYVKRYGRFEGVIIIVGDGPQLEYLKKLGEKLNVTEYLVFMGAVKNSDVYSMMNAADLLISLYESSNIGNPFFEAMRCGLPFAAVNNGDTSLWVEHGSNGFLIDENNIVLELVEIFEKVMGGEIDISTMRDKVFSFSNEKVLTWGRRMDIEVDAIERLINRSL